MSFADCKLKVLVVDPSRTSYEIVRRGLDMLPYAIESLHCANIEKGTEFLSASQGEHHPEDWDVVIMEMELKDDLSPSLLRFIKTRRTLGHIKIIINTASTSLECMREAKKWEDATYLRKGRFNSRAIYQELMRTKPTLLVA